MLQAHIEIELDDGVLDALVACPDGHGRRPPILLFPDRRGVTPEVESQVRRLSAHNYFVLSPDLRGRSADDRREAAWAALDHLADDRRVDDSRVGVLGFGPGADLALNLTAWRAERVAACAAYGGRGFGPHSSLEIAQRINGFVRIGYAFGALSPRAGLIETALGRAGVLFDVEVYGGEPDWADLIDLFDRTLARPAAPPTPSAQPQVDGYLGGDRFSCSAPRAPR